MVWYSWSKTYTIRIIVCYSSSDINEVFWCSCIAYISYINSYALSNLSPPGSTLFVKRSHAECPMFTESMYSLRSLFILFNQAFNFYIQVFLVLRSIHTLPGRKKISVIGVRTCMHVINHVYILTTYRREYLYCIYRR